MSIAHASGSGDDSPALLHAAALARNRARLVIVHAGPENALPPGASELAARWGLPIELCRVELDDSDDISDSIVESLRQLQPDLMVVGTHARRGLAAWLCGSVGETFARNFESS